MVKKFTANCDFPGKKSPVTLYVGNPALGSHPLNFQNKWLSENKGGAIPQDIMNSFEKLVELSEKNRVPFEDLCEYVIEELKSIASVGKDANRAKEFSTKKDDKK